MDQYSDIINKFEEDLLEVEALVNSKSLAMSGGLDCESNNSAPKQQSYSPTNEESPLVNDEPLATTEEFTAGNDEFQPNSEEYQSNNTEESATPIAQEMPPRSKHTQPRSALLKDQEKASKKAWRSSRPRVIPPIAAGDLVQLPKDIEEDSRTKKQRASTNPSKQQEEAQVRDSLPCYF